MNCIFFRETIPDDDDVFLSSFQKYITAKNNNNLENLILSSDECEYILDKLYIEELKLELLTFSEIAVDLHPFSDEILVRRCNVLIDNGYVDLSVDLLKSRQSLFLDSKLFKTACVNSYLLLQEYEIAHNYATFILDYPINDIEDNSELVNDFDVFGNMCMEGGNYKEAIFYFNSIDKFSKPSLNVLKNLAKCQLILMIEYDSINSYTKHLEEDPYNYRLWYKLGVLQFKMQLFDDAVESLNNSLAISPNCLDVLNFLSEVYFSMDMNYKAISIINRYVDLEKDDEKKNNYLYNLCFTLFSSGNCSGAKLVLPLITNYDKDKIRCAELSISVIEKCANFKEPGDEDLEKLPRDIEEISIFGQEWLTIIIDHSYKFSRRVLMALYNNWKG